MQIVMNYLPQMNRLIKQLKTKSAHPQPNLLICGLKKIQIQPQMDRFIKQSKTKFANLWL